MHAHDRLIVFFKNHSGAIIIFGFGIVVGLMGWLTVSSLSKLNGIRANIEEIVVQHNEHAGLVRKMYQTTRDRSLLLQKIITEPDLFARDELAVRVDELGAEFAKFRAAFMKLALLPAEKELLERQGAASAKTKPLQYQVIDLAMQGNLAEAQRVLVYDALPAQDAALAALNDLLTHQDQQIKIFAEAAYQREKEAYTFLLLGGFGSILLSILIAFFVRTRIKKAEAVLHRGKEELERMVNDQTTELREREEILRSITGAAQDAIIMIDGAGNISYWNRAAQLILGYAEKEALGKNLHDLIAPPHFREAHKAPFAHFSRTGEGSLLGKTTEVAALRRDGSEIPVDLSLSAVNVQGQWSAIGILRDISERKHAEAALQKLATTDPLTGIANRRKFNETLESEIQRSQRHDIPLALILMDIDYFKKINDTFGHPAGDSVLTEFARIVEANIRANDQLARWGGEEFILLAPHVDAENARQLADKLCREIGKFQFTDAGGVTCSLGITSYRPDETIQELIARVDSALYLAKQNGRNRVEQL